jgi:hypothetical protein
MPIAPAAGSLKPRQPLSLNRIYFTGETSRQAKFAFGGVRPADAVSVAHTLAYILRVEVHCSNGKHASKQFSLSMTDIEHAAPFDRRVRCQHDSEQSRDHRNVQQRFGNGTAAVQSTGEEQ